MFEAAAPAVRKPGENVFDPDDIRVEGHFLAPSGRRYVVPAFYFQDFGRRLVDGVEVLTPVGAPLWKTRFSPPEPGAWQWWWTTSRNGDAGVSTERRRLKVADSPLPGPVRVSSKDRRYLSFGDGSPFFAIGENVGWYDRRGSYAYDDWYDDLSDAGANYARIWMPAWAFGIEGPEAPAGEYSHRLDRAWQLDQVFRRAERRGIYQVVSLLAGSEFTDHGGWKENPYNSTNGGPLASPRDVFQDDRARELLRRRIRYVVARWGYSNHLLAWELWNEFDAIAPTDDPQAAAWHREMAAYLRELDAGAHLITTSTSGYAGGQLLGVDYGQQHAYLNQLPGGMQSDVSTALRGLPIGVGLPGGETYPRLLAEIGVSAQGAEDTAAKDPDGTVVRDGLWAGWAFGGLGTGMTWWWDDYIAKRPMHFYPMMTSVARFLRGVRWDQAGFEAASAWGVAEGQSLSVSGLQGKDLVLLWIKDSTHTWRNPNAVTIDGAALLAPGTGCWRGWWWHTGEGRKLADAAVSDGADRMLKIPPFQGDVALRLERCSR